MNPLLPLLPLTSFEGQQLLQLGRAQLIAATSENESNRFSLNLKKLSPRLQEKQGAFVTLYRFPQTARDSQPGSTFEYKELRGCIGTILPLFPLYQAILNNIVSAALCDQRFLPVREEEVKRIKIELNILSLPQKSSLEKIELGRDGILFSYDATANPNHRPWTNEFSASAQAVFLPQVPIEQGWDLPTTLQHLALKAGLRPDAWKEENRVEIKTFESQIFLEGS